MGVEKRSEERPGGGGQTRGGESYDPHLEGRWTISTWSGETASIWGMSL